jgi:hypothetical protein
VDCPACGSFNSALDEECDECGISLVKAREPVERDRPYRKSEHPITPDPGERKRLRSWVREALRQGEDEEAVNESLVQKGYDAEWVSGFVAGVAARFADDEPLVQPEGNFGLGFLFGFLCTFPTVIYLLAGGGKPETRRGAIRGLAISFAFAVLVALLDK